MKKYFLFIAYLLLHSYFSNAQYQQINTNTSRLLLTQNHVPNFNLVGTTDSFLFYFNDNDTTLSYLIPPSINHCSQQIKIIDSNTFFILGCLPLSNPCYVLFKTKNKGITWDTILVLDNVNYVANNFEIIDSNNYIVFCNSGVTFKTSNGGSTWQISNYPSHSPSVTAKFEDSMLCAGSDIPFNFFTSKDRGNNWISAYGTLYQAGYIDISILNKNTIYSLAYIPFNQYYLSYSLNGGDTFQNKLIPIDDFRKVVFTSVAEGYVVGLKNNLGVILSTKDTGTTWQTYYTTNQGLLWNIDFLNDSIALISGTNGYLAKWNKNSFALSVVNEGNQMNNSISIHPNPTFNSQQIEIELVKDADLEINLISILGQKLKNIQHHNQSKGNIKVNTDLTDLSNGIYFYEIIIDNKKQYIKTIKD